MDSLLSTHTDRRRLSILELLELLVLLVLLELLSIAPDDSSNVQELVPDEMWRVNSQHPQPQHVTPMDY